MLRFDSVKIFLVFLIMHLSLAVSAFSQANPQVMTWTVNGQQRQALIYIPTSAHAKPTPVIFAFHGHGGTMYNMYRSRGFEKLWPEAIFICPQGLNTVGPLVDPEGKQPGWEKNADNSNRDVQFFDAMLKTLESSYNIDHSRIYVTGHSNGGNFTFILWALRGNIFAAIALTSSAGAKLLPLLISKPMFHSLGDSDPLVNSTLQRATDTYIKKLNGCSAEGKQIAPCTTLYTSATGNPVVVDDHPGGHEYPQAANQLIINFFKEQNKK